MKGRNILGYLHLLEWTTRLDYWTGLLDWTTGLDYWTGLLDWTTGPHINYMLGCYTKHTY